MNAKLAKAISRVAEEKSKEELYEFLLRLESRNLVSLLHDSVCYCEGFIRTLVDRMNRKLSNGEWVGSEIKASNALRKIACAEDELILVDAFGFPAEISDNGQLLKEMGLFA